MILTVDIGNTATTMGLYTPEGTLRFRGALKTDKNKTQDQLAIDLLDMFHLYQADIGEVTGGVISSVVPPMTHAMAGAIRQLSGVRPMIVGPGVKTGMNILAEVHNQLGADIVASSVAALQKYPQPIIVIDMGTATTLSYLGNNTYEGCVIIPGVRIAVEALSGRAGKTWSSAVGGMGRWAWARARRTRGSNASRERGRPAGSSSRERVRTTPAASGEMVMGYLLPVPQNTPLL